MAAVLWIATGLMRAFGGLEKGSDYYLHNSLFWLKMGLFGAVFILELPPMFTLISWRIALKKGNQAPSWAPAKLKHLILHNDLETALVFLIPFVASLMSRGVG